MAQLAAFLHSQGISGLDSWLPAPVLFNPSEMDHEELSSWWSSHRFFFSCKGNTVFLSLILKYVFSSEMDIGITSLWSKFFPLFPTPSTGNLNKYNFGELENPETWSSEGRNSIITRSEKKPGGRHGSCHHGVWEISDLPGVQEAWHNSVCQAVLWQHFLFQKQTGREALGGTQVGGFSVSDGSR